MMATWVYLVRFVSRLGREDSDIRAVAADTINTRGIYHVKYASQRLARVPSLCPAILIVISSSRYNASSSY
jgi:hypothetical protein